VILGSVQSWTLLIGPGPSRDTLENENLDSSRDLLFVKTKSFLVLRAGRNVYYLTQFRAEGVPCGQRAVAHEPDALPPARLSKRSQVRPPATRPPPRRVPAEGDGRQQRRPAASVAGVYRCATASGDGVRHGVRHGEPHCPPPTRHAAHHPRDAIPRTGRHPRPRRTTPPPPKMCRPSVAWERRAGRCGRLPLAEPPHRPWRTRPPHDTPAAEPTACPPLHPTLACNPPHHAPHPTIPRPPPRPPPRPTIHRTPPRQPPHRRHAGHRALRTRAAPHPATRHL